MAGYSTTKGKEGDMADMAEMNEMIVWAAREDDSETVLKLLGDGAPGNAEDAMGRTLLCEAAGHPDGRTLAVLLEWMNPNDKIHMDCHGITPLYRAVWEDHGMNVRRLLEAGADPNLATHDGFPSLVRAARNGSPDVVSRLLSAGADPSKAEPGGATALHAASTWAWDDEDPTEGQGHLRAAERLLEAGANPNAKDSHGNTPLHMAAESDRVDLCKALLAAGADPTARNDRMVGVFSKAGNDVMNALSDGRLELPTGPACRLGRRAMS